MSTTAEVRRQCLAEAIERRIMERTWRQIRRLRIDVLPNDVYVHGQTESYYVKQLAIQAILETLPPHRDRRLNLDIVVGGASLHGVSRR